MEYLVAGDTAGFPFVMQHGTPGAGVPFPHAHTLAAERGLALVLTTRAGYGESSRAAGRRVADVTGDITAVLDDLGASQFVTLGWSGGGPHALACAALLPDRCRAAATGAGVAPWVEGQGLDFLSGMGPENVEEFTLALSGEAQLRPYLDRAAQGMGSGTVEGVLDALAGLLSPVDAEALSHEFAERLIASSQRALRHGVDGWVDDDLAFTQGWGFDLDAIEVPVSIWQGAKDQMVPISHGMWLAEHVPGARVHLEPEQGHISMLRRLDRVLDDLVDRADLPVAG